MISLSSPVRTRAHEWPAGPKLLCLCFATILLFFIENLFVHLAIFASLIAIYALPGPVFFKSGMRQLKMLWPFVLVVLIWHWWIDQSMLGMVIIFRMLNALALANLVSMSTRLSDMMDAIRPLTGMFRVFGLKSNVLELAIALVIRITPVLVQKGNTLIESWRARSHKKAGWRIILPFTIIALDDADHIAEALRARGGFENIKD